MVPSLRVPVLIAALLTLAGAPAPAQDAGQADNFELIGHWGHGSCWAVTVDGDRVLMGSGSVLEICTFDASDDLQRVGSLALPSPVQGIAVVGDLAYVASRDAGLRIVNLADPTDPYEVGSAWVPDDVWDVAVAGDHAYLAGDGDGLRVIDISDPTAPVETGSVSTDGQALKLRVVGDHVYMVEGYASPSHLATMGVFDVSDPDAPFRTGTYELPDHSYNYAWGLDVVGDRVYVGYEHGRIRVVDVSDPAAPMAVGGFDEGLDDINDVKIVGGYLYVAYSWMGLGVFDLADPLHPLPVAVVDTPEDARRIDVAGGRAFIADQEGGLQVFDVSDPTTPVLEQARATAGNSHDVCVDGHFAYVADEMFGLRILDLRRRDLPHEVGALQLAGYPVTVDVMDGHAYVASSSAGLRVVDVRDPRNPVEVSWWDLGGTFESVTAAGGYVYTTEWGGPLRIFDVSDPTLPVLAGGFNSTFYTRHSVLKDGYLYCANRYTYRSLWVLDVSDPAAVTSVGGTYDLTGTAWGLALQDDHLYLTAGGTGVHILDATDPKALSWVGTYDPSDGANGIAAHGGYVYVAGGGRVWMLDVATPSAPAWAGWYDTGDVCWEIAILDGDLVVADHDDGVLVLRNELRAPSSVGDDVPDAPPAVVCRPNPCNPATTVAFHVPRAGQVRVGVLDARGRLVARLLDRRLAAGPAEVLWRGRDDEGRDVSSGVYLVRVETVAGVVTGKIALVR